MEITNPHITSVIENINYTLLCKRCYNTHTTITSHSYKIKSNTSKNPQCPLCTNNPIRLKLAQMIHINQPPIHKPKDPNLTSTDHYTLIHLNHNTSNETTAITTTALLPPLLQQPYDITSTLLRDFARYKVSCNYCTICYILSLKSKIVSTTFLAPTLRPCPYCSTHLTFQFHSDKNLHRIHASTPYNSKYFTTVITGNTILKLSSPKSTPRQSIQDIRKDPTPKPPSTFKKGKHYCSQCLYNSIFYGKMISHINKNHTNLY